MMRRVRRCKCILTKKVDVEEEGGEKLRSVKKGRKRRWWGQGRTGREERSRTKHEVRNDVFSYFLFCEQAPAADDDDDMDPFGDETEEEKKAAEEKKGGKDTKKPKGRRKMKSAAYLTRRLMKAETDVQPEALKVVNLEDLYGTLATTLVNFEDL
ncbi:unnamed protein product [Brassica rapa subsp. trilocularis]